MRKYKITHQQKWFNENEIIPEKDTILFVECDFYEKIYDGYEITPININFANKYINSSYKIGDKHTSYLKLLKIFIDDKSNEIYALADQHLKIEENINEEWSEIYSHKNHCGC